MCFRSFAQFQYYFRPGVTLFRQLTPSHLPLQNLLRGLRKHQATAFKTDCGMLLLFLTWKICKRKFFSIFLIFEKSTFCSRFFTHWEQCFLLSLGKMELFWRILSKLLTLRLGLIQAIPFSISVQFTEKPTSGNM